MEGDARGISYTKWKIRAKKTRELDKTIKKIFGKQLRMIKGNSAEKVSAILDKYACLSKLLASYDFCSSKESEDQLLAGLRWGAKRKILGNAQSKRIRDFFRSIRYTDDDNNDA